MSCSPICAAQTWRVTAPGGNCVGTVCSCAALGMRLHVANSMPSHRCRLTQKTPWWEGKSLTGNLSEQFLQQQKKVTLIVTGGNCTVRACIHGMRLAAAVAKHKLSNSKAPLVKSFHWNAVKFVGPHLVSRPIYNTHPRTFGMSLNLLSAMYFSKEHA